ncbi:MAG TPA: hypothetical protein VHT03_01890 [Rhizomicrobium sp.]|jgi:hypothetical protein|nr:hypothetical protein [Rhizomicrobium sp.]
MPWLESTRTARAFYPFLASATVATFLLRGRQIASSNSPGSGVSIAGSEILMRFSAIAHAALSLAVGALSLLFRLVLAPPHFAVATMESEFRIALYAVEHGVSLLHLATTYLLHGV